MKEDQPPTTFDQGTILSGMTGSGKFRAVFVTGPSNQNKAKKLAELGTAIVRKEPSSFCALIDSRKTQSPYEWCSQFARTLRTMNGAEPMALAKFAMAVGRSLIPFKPGGAESNPESEANEKVVSKLVKHFEELTEHLPKGANSPKLVIVMDKFESMDNAMLEWLSSTVNQAFRKSPSFTASRFIFSANQKTSEVSDFFSRFGFDKVHEFIFGGLSNPAEAQAMDPVSMAHKTATQIQPSPEIKENKNSLKNAIPSSNSQEMDNPRLVTNLKKAKDFFSNYSDDQQHFLILSSYPGKISRYSLEFFSSSRDAALCYNWLKRQTGLCENLANGDLSLKQDVVEFARLIHQERNKEESGKWATLSTVLDTFFKKFPDKNSHWIPVNLHKLNWFNDSLIDRLFAVNQCDEIKNFITSNEHAFTTDGNKVSLTEENKVLTQRLLDLSHLEPFAGLLEKTREQWIVDSEKSSSKRTRLENEKKNLVKDVAEAIEEVSSLNNFKEKLAEEFKHPGSLRPERILSFSSSVLLIVIGLGTVGLSLLSESLGSYHAACGLGITLFGFFWPTIELKRATETATIASSPLTLDAQQHSLENRISNLNNRLKVMQGNLEVVEGQISKIGDNQEEPYVELED